MFNHHTNRFATVLFALSVASAGHAATIKVPAHQPTIMDAVGAAVDGDKIVISEGTYYESVIVGFRHDLTIKAKGDVTIDAGGSNFGLSVAFCSNVKVQGLTIRNAALAMGRIVEGSQNRFEDCTFKGGDGSGVHIEAGTEHEIIDCLVQNTLGTGAVIESSSSYISGCKLVNCGQVLGSAAIGLYGPYLTAESNEILDDGVGHGMIIGIGGADTHHALALGNEITGVGQDGIYLNNASDCMVMDNMIKEPGDDGIDIASTASGNTLDRNLISGAEHYGIETSGDDNTAIKNRVKKSVSHGVRIDGSAVGGFWFKNKIKQSGHRGIYVLGTGHSFTKNVAKGSVDEDWQDDTAEGANDYLDNVFANTGS